MAKYGVRQKKKFIPLMVFFIVLLILSGTFYFLYSQNKISFANSKYFTDLQKTIKELTSGSGGTVLSLKDYVEGLFKTNQSPTDNISTDGGLESNRIIGRIAIVSDSHGDTEIFTKVISKIRTENVDFLIHLGDVSTGGELKELHSIKSVLDQSGLNYYVLPGDHDFNWVPDYNLDNFQNVFNFSSAESINQIIEYRGFTLFLYNNAKPEETQTTEFNWLQNSLVSENRDSQKKIFLLTSMPFTNPYFQNKQDPQGREVLSLLDAYQVEQVFSGDTHIFSRYTDDQTDITTTTVGASGSYKNPLLQYVLVEFYSSGNFEVKAKPVVDVESFD